MCDEPLVSVVFSFRNEREVLSELIRRVTTMFGALPFRHEMIFVDDASTDDSLSLLTEEREGNRAIHIVSMSRRFGVAPCVLAGFRHARGDAVIYMDADLQDPPEVIPALLDAWQAGAEVVHTVRTARHGESSVKMWLTRQAYRLINRVASIDIRENAGDFKLLSRRAVDALLEIEEPDPFLRGMVAWIGFRQDTVPYEREARFAGRTKFSLLRSSNPYKEFVRGLTAFSVMPLYVAVWAGVILGLVGFIWLAWLIIAGCFSEEGWSAVMGMLVLLAGVILVAIGVLGIYVGNMHQALKRRPGYIIRERVGFDEDR